MSNMNGIVLDALHKWMPFVRGGEECASSSSPVYVRGLNGDSRAFFIREVYERMCMKPCLIVTAGEREAGELYTSLRTVCPATSIFLIPWWGTIPYRAAAVGSIVFGQRAAALSHLASGEGALYITTERAFLSPLPPPASFFERALTLSAGNKIDSAKAAEALVRAGYTRVPRVRVHGEFSMRGEVIDVYMYADESPVRIKLDYNAISSVRHFDCDTQLSLDTLDKVIIPAGREVLWDDKQISMLEARLQEMDSTPLPFTDNAKKRLDEMLLELKINGASEGEELLYPLLFGKGCGADFTTFSDYGKAFLILMDAERLSNNESSILMENTAMYRKGRGDFPCLSPQEMIIPLDDMLSRFPRRLSLCALKAYDNETDSSARSTSINLKTEPSRSFFGNINFLKETLASLIADGWKTAVYAGGDMQQARIKAILKDEDGKPLATVLPDEIIEGFSVPDIRLLVIQEGEIFGRKKRERPIALRKAKSEAIDTFVELNPGDFVVHADYGIGIFRSIDRVKALGHERDYITIEYADGDKVFVPTEQVNLVQRYIGSSGSPPRLDKIGTSSWEKRKGKTARAVEEMAQKLLALYARREASVGVAFPPDGEWQAAFEASFPYEDTPDQTTVTEEIKRDMEKSVPMDRLICGDVGYGKTEVAMRAAFKAVMGGAQVAFLSPTTILAEQHYETLTERFKGFPVKVALLSRFVSSPDQKRVIAHLVSGEVDIVVGTHRIIQNDVRFKHLGLLVIDEEQRFGVKDKEKLKVMKANIDCLAMSATPIPRTLHMSLLKIRDMSLLTTPPQNRQAVETTVEAYSDERVAQSIRREAERGGQVFYLHNRIESLMDTKRHIERLVPEMMCECAHGAMKASELEDIFRRFKAGAFHVLVSTTIIENGIDIPNVNTIIIDRADMYGIGQLYQLRGRVGRSDRKAYAYLLYPGKRVLSEVAMKRLEAISDFTELGSGFKIAMKDMEIRGAGNLLGRDQSGEICSVGFDMYMRLLSQAVDRLKMAKDYKSSTEVAIEINYTGFIPDTYIDNAESKMEVYKQIAAAGSKEEIESLSASLIDRFGDIPESVATLLSLSEVKAIASKLGICSIKEEDAATNQGVSKVIVIEAQTASSIKLDRLLTLIKENPATISLSPKEANKIFLKCGTLEKAEEKVGFLKQILERLQ